MNTIKTIEEARNLLHTTDISKKAQVLRFLLNEIDKPKQSPSYGPIKRDLSPIETIKELANIENDEVMTDLLDQNKNSKTTSVKIQVLTECKNEAIERRPYELACVLREEIQRIKRRN